VAGSLAWPVQGRRRSTALAAFAMITANGGITSATAETTIAAVTEYRSSTAQERTNNPMQTVMSTRYRRLSRRDGCGPGGCGPGGRGAADPSRSPPLSVASPSPSRKHLRAWRFPIAGLSNTDEHAYAARALSPSGRRCFTSLTGLACIKAIFDSSQRPIIVVDSGLVEEKVDHSAPNQPRSPNPPLSFSASTYHGPLPHHGTHRPHPHGREPQRLGQYLTHCD